MSAQPLPFAEVPQRPTEQRGTLIYMPTEHEPVLATELVDLLAPQPGEVAIDCTFGGGGHARLVAEKLGPTGDADLHRPRPRGREPLRQGSPPSSTCRTRFIRADFAGGADHPARRRHPRQTWSTWTSGCPRCRSTPGSGASPTPTTRRSTCAWTPPGVLSAADSSTSGRESRLAQALRSFGEERCAGGDRPRDRQAPPAETTSDLVDAVKAGMPASARFGGGHPAKRTFQAIRIAVNGELDALRRRCRSPGSCSRDRRPPRRDLLPLARGPPRQALPGRARPRLRLPARAAGLRLRPRARGRAADPARGRARPTRSVERQPALALRPPARRPEARRGGQD